MKDSSPFLRILLSVLCISGPAFMAWLYLLQVREAKKNDTKYTITHLVHKGPLSTAYLTETLGLSQTAPVNLYRFDLKKGEQRLLQGGLLKEASIKRSPPNALVITYTVRSPIARLPDGQVVDREGITFCSSPLFDLVPLPVLTGGQQSEALALTEKWTENFPSYSLKKVDLSLKNKESYGQREVRLTVGEEEHLLRLSTDHLDQDLRSFQTLLTKGLLSNKKNCVIDLRIPRQALVIPKSVYEKS